MAWNQSAEPKQAKRSGWPFPPVRLKWLLLGLVVVAAGIWMTCGRSTTAAPDNVKTDKAKTARLEKRAKKSAPQTAEQAVRSKMPKQLPKRARKVRKGPVEMFDHLHGEDRKMAEAVQEALDADDLRATIEAAQKAMTSTNTEVRINAVEALGWFGAEALPELTGCMSDSDEEVRDAAENQWELAAQQVEKPDERFDIVAAALGTLSDENQLTSLGGILSCAATEAIDGEEDEVRSAEMRLHVVQTLVDIIEGDANQVNVAAAKEAFNDITNNEWRGLDEAQRYLDDPENYEPPEG